MAKSHVAETFTKQATGKWNELRQGNLFCIWLLTSFFCQTKPAVPIFPKSSNCRSLTTHAKQLIKFLFTLVHQNFCEWGIIKVPTVMAHLHPQPKFFCSNYENNFQHAIIRVTEWGKMPPLNYFFPACFSSRHQTIVSFLITHAWHATQIAFQCSLPH